MISLKTFWLSIWKQIKRVLICGVEEIKKITLSEFKCEWQNFIYHFVLHFKVQNVPVQKFMNSETCFVFQIVPRTILFSDWQEIEIFSQITFFSHHLFFVEGLKESTTSQSVAWPLKRSNCAQIPLYLSHFRYLSLNELIGGKTTLHERILQSQITWLVTKSSLKLLLSSQQLDQSSEAVEHLFLFWGFMQIFLRSNYPGCCKLKEVVTKITDWR